MQDEKIVVNDEDAFAGTHHDGLEVEWDDMRRTGSARVANNYLHVWPTLAPDSARIVFCFHPAGLIVSDVDDVSIQCGRTGRVGDVTNMRAIIEKESSDIVKVRIDSATNSGMHLTCDISAFDIRNARALRRWRTCLFPAARSFGRALITLRRLHEEVRFRPEHSGAAECKAEFESLL